MFKCVWICFIKINIFIAGKQLKISKVIFIFLFHDSSFNFVKTRFGIEYKQAQIYNILHFLGFSFQKGKGYFPEIGERTEKLEAIKKTSNCK